MSAPLKIIQLDTVESTNSYAWALAEKGEKEIAMIKANSQTKGKGRMGRSWDSPPDVGIYASFILRPSNSLVDIQELPLVFALGVTKVLAPLVNAKIKEPNDIMVNNKKVCGVLVETKGAQQAVDFVVAGIGLNVNNSETELIDGATSLYFETKKRYNIEEIFKKIVIAELALYEQFKQGNLNLIQKELEVYKK